jgi:hypothetical protein
MGTAAVLGVVIASIYLLFPRRHGKRKLAKDQPTESLEQQLEMPDTDGKPATQRAVNR